MYKVAKFLALATVLLLGAHCTVSLADTQTSAPFERDVGTIYAMFLGHWHNISRSQIYVSQSLRQPTHEDLNQYEECVKKIGKKKVNWTLDRTITPLSSIIGGLSYVRLIDPQANPKKWHRVNIRKLIANGDSVRDAISASMAHGFYTLSEVTFNKSHTIAVFKYSFVCGHHCGTGHVVIFVKKPNGWVQNMSTCGLWALRAP